MSDNKNILLRDALKMYLDRVSVHKKGHLQEKYRIGQYCRLPIADLPIRLITSVHVAQFRDERLSQISPRTQRTIAPATVRLDLALLSNLFRIGKIEWGICVDNPVANVRKPKLPAGRDRRITAREERMLMRYCTKSGNAQLKAIIQLALETAMRQGEILALRWEQINLKSRIAHLPDTKNGSRRDVPLTMLARDIIIAQGVKTSGPVFTYTSSGLKSTWRFMVKRLAIDNLHFHDLRHEAISRLVERGVFDLMEVAAISGHKTLTMLKRYVHLRSQRLVRKLDAGSNKGRAVILSQLVPYPACIERQDSRVAVRFPDFDDLHAVGVNVETAMQRAQDVLLRHILILMRNGRSIPSPDNYVEDIDESKIVRLDPLGTYETLPIESDVLLETIT
jgi:integrase/predicted RNase H-like HicB family nuclease